ncbi:MAG: hypothetical protein ISR65_18730 [Bacteriovoracaceae bacterium]|nr:hypothetical protein [Bacteriovoracaceae bacterium]
MGTIGRSMIKSLNDIFMKPSKLKKLTTDQVTKFAKHEGWHIGTLGRGSKKGQGLIVRKLNSAGNPTDKMIQWHPGGGHHGTQPYWKLSSGETGTVRIGPQFD